MAKHAEYLIEARKNSALIIRSKTSDSVEMTVASARTLRADLGKEYQIVVVRDGVTFQEYEWAKLLEDWSR